MTWTRLMPTPPEPPSRPTPGAGNVWAVPESVAGTRPDPGLGPQQSHSLRPADVLLKVWHWLHRRRPPEILHMTVREFLAIFDHGSQDERFIDRADSDEYTRLVSYLVQHDRKDDSGPGPAA